MKLQILLKKLLHNFYFFTFLILENALIYSLQNKNAWQVIVLLYLISNRFTKEEKLVIFSIFLFSYYLNIYFCFMLTILFTTYNTSKNFHKNIKTILFFF